MPRHRSIFVSVIGSIALALAPAACGNNKKEVEAAKHSLYDTDFAIVYSAALDATRDLYPNLDDAPGAGAIRTSWHQVVFANTQDDLANPSVVANGNPTATSVAGGNPQTSAAAGAAGMPTRLAYKRFFIRFDVTVMGGRPWRVKIVGHASEWAPGAAMPVELHGIARPPWLEPRTDALLLAIHNKLKTHAIAMKETPKADPVEALPKTDVGMFKELPAAAAQRLAHVRDACTRREFQSLRADLADDVVFAPGSEGNADTALALWQADPDTLEQMAKVITPACAQAGDTIACPSGARIGTYQLVIAQRGADWKVTSFVRAE